MSRLAEFQNTLLQREGQLKMAEDELAESEVDVKKIRSHRNTILLSRDILSKIAKLKREETTQKIEKIVSHGLQSVLKDSSVQFKIIEHQTEKNINYKFALEGKGYTSEDIRNEKGGGVQNLVSFILTVILSLMLDSNQTRFFVFDEKFAQLSRNYLPAAGSLMRELADRLGCQFLLVSHQTELESHADVVYEFAQNSSGITSATRIS